MEICRGILQQKEPSAVALGFFDGVHTAHAQVIRAVLGHEGCVPTVLTFSADTVLPVSKSGSGLLLTEDQKRRRIEALGVERLFEPSFSEIGMLSAEEFFFEALHTRLRAQVISCGYDYRFGKGAKGDVSLLQRLCKENHVRLIVTPCCSDHGITVSSSEIRRAILSGDMTRANELLGYRYTIDGTVVHGRSLGRTLGFPTLNQHLWEGLLLPKFGVYASITKIGGRTYRSITNIGVKPTIEGERAPLAETYMLDAEGDFYGQEASVSLLHMSREECRFSGIEELKQTVLRDIAYRRTERE